MRASRKTFNEILAECVFTDAGTLMEKARLHGRLAKFARDRSGRRLAYAWKTRCIRQLLRCCGDVVRLRHDADHRDSAMLIVRVPGHGGLHIHRRRVDAA